MENIINFDLHHLNDFKIIYVLVSGGIDSTYLWELIHEKYPLKSIAVNCYNSYESNETLDFILEKNASITIKPDPKYKPVDVLKESFLNIPKALENKKAGKYHKKVFPCCKIFKHDMFKKDRRFVKRFACVVSGIKHGDGSQRAAFLSMLRNGKLIVGTANRCNNYRFMKDPKWDFTPLPTYFHKHVWGAIYVYPFRDFYKRELPEKTLTELKYKYPTLKHSGCYLCPVLVVFDIKSEGKRYERSLDYARKLGVRLK